MSKPLVAIVGRPNVGKSTLFNKLSGKRISIVNDTPGITRDRIYSDCEWSGKEFSLVDTGGIELDSEDEILKKIKNQADFAISAADVIILVVNIKTGFTSSDEKIALYLKKSNKPVILCVNKCDNTGEVDSEFYEFYKLALGDPVAVSSVHGHGTGDLLDKILENLPEKVQEENDIQEIKVAIIGKPNAGKSSLINKITGQERSIVSDSSGTTRDSVNSFVKNKFGNYLFIDTAGLRRKSKIDEDIEKYSVIRAKNAIKESDVCVILIDVQQGFTEQDSKVAGLAHNEGKACIIAVNKWDSIKKETNTMQEYYKKLENDFNFMHYSPIIFISAKTGLNLNNLFLNINNVYKSSITRISTGIINNVLSEAVLRVQPPTDKGKRLKIYYMTQVSIKPPTFVFFVNFKKLFHFSYQRYLENKIRETFGLIGTPIRFIIREKGEEH